MVCTIGRWILLASLASVGYASKPNDVMAQAILADPVIEEPIRPMFSDSETDIPTISVGCGQLSLAPLLFGLPSLLMMSICGPKCSFYKRYSG